MIELLQQSNINGLMWGYMGMEGVFFSSPLLRLAVGGYIYINIAIDIDIYIAIDIDTKTDYYGIEMGRL